MARCRHICSARWLLSPLITSAAPTRSHAALISRAGITNDNTTTAGTLRAGVLSVSLVGEVARWFPGPDSAPPVVTQLFGEEGKAPSNPGRCFACRSARASISRFATRCPTRCSSRRRASGRARRPDTLRLAPGATGRSDASRRRRPGHVRLLGRADSPRETGRRTTTTAVNSPASSSSTRAAADTRSDLHGLDLRSRA